MTSFPLFHIGLDLPKRALESLSQQGAKGQRKPATWYAGCDTGIQDGGGDLTSGQ